MPNTFTAHGWAFEEGVPALQATVYRWIERAVGLISDKVIAVSDYGKTYAIENKVVSEDKIVTIHNGVEDTNLQRDVGYASDCPQSLFKMVMIAGFRKQKDHKSLIMALSQLTNEQWSIHFLGDGPLMAECIELCESLGIEDKVHFEGAVSDVSSFLSKSDLLVLSTNWEGLPLSVLEGLAHSLPILATNIPGIREQVIDGYNGITFDRGSVKMLSESIEKFMSGELPLEKYSENSRDLYTQKYRLEVMCERTLDLYSRSVEKDDRATIVASRPVENCIDFDLGFGAGSGEDGLSESPVQSDKNSIQRPMVPKVLE